MEVLNECQACHLYPLWKLAAFVMETIPLWEEGDVRLLWQCNSTPGMWVINKCSMQYNTSTTWACS